MAVEQCNHGRARGCTKLEFSFVHVFPNVLAAVVNVEVALPIGHKSHQKGSWLEGLQGANVNAGTPSAEVVKVVRGEQF